MEPNLEKRRKEYIDHIHQVQNRWTGFRCMIFGCGTIVFIIMLIIFFLYMTH
jgi:hypothetical protein